MKKITREEAKEQNLVKYFGGPPCKYGHEMERYTKGNACCECMRLINKKKNKLSPEITKKSHRIWAQNNKEHLRDYHRQWRERNPDKVKTYYDDKVHKTRSGYYPLFDK